MTLKPLTNLRIRTLQSRSDFEACCALQRQTWGAAFTERVPASVLMVTVKTGGILLGAFSGSKMIGFVLSFAGWDGDKKILWSDMLAVHEQFRNRSIGLRLKLHQRRLALKQGVQEIRWTFDPLESRNAYFNLAKLGVQVRSYFPNLYGRTQSPAHRNLDTDRMLAVWSLAAGGLGKNRGKQPVLPVVDHRWVNRCGLTRQELLRSSPPNLRLRVRQVWFEIPANFDHLCRTNHRLARSWLKLTRQVCTRYLHRGYVIDNFLKIPIEGRQASIYVFSRKAKGDFS
ncbi:MAG: GNAT family N-acetyltransferase [Acidobacteriota bacterium]